MVVPFGNLVEQDATESIHPMRNFLLRIDREGNKKRLASFDSQASIEERRPATDCLRMCKISPVKFPNYFIRKISWMNIRTKNTN